MKQIKQNQKGVTLVALIVTVIILLILAGTVISISVNGGDLFGKETEAVNEWNKEVAAEETEVNNIFELMDEATTGVKQVVDSNPGVLEASTIVQNAYVINSIEDLVAFAYLVNSGESTYNNKTVYLGANLDFAKDKSYVNPNAKYEETAYGYTASESGTALKELLTNTSGKGFIPISNDANLNYTGTFDGQNYTIYNLYENITSNGGLFGATKLSLEIKNLGIKKANINASLSSGAVIGSAIIITIENCNSSGNIVSGYPAAGIIGEFDTTATITNCGNDCKVSVLNGGPAGGILGYTETGTINISGCYNNGEIYATNCPSGGIIGDTNGATINISNCYNTGKIINTTTPHGGIIGFSGGNVTMSNCYNTGTITGEADSCGGIIGTLRANSPQPVVSTISDCYNTGNVMSTDEETILTSASAGILAVALDDKLSVTITNCYNSGTITATAAQYNHAGGIVGSNVRTNSLTVLNCFNSGKITGGQLGGGIQAYAAIYTANSERIENCINTGEVEGQNHCAGMLAFLYNESIQIKNCYNLGHIKSAIEAGGIFGLTGEGIVVDECYNTGTIETLGNSAVGGIAGYGATITNCHNSGDIVGGSSSPKGEIIGYGTEGTGCTYLLKGTNGSNNATATVATGKTESEMNPPMTLTSFVGLMNTYVATNNSNSSNPHLLSWRVSSGAPAFVK